MFDGCYLVALGFGNFVVVLRWFGGLIVFWLIVLISWVACVRFIIGFGYGVYCCVGFVGFAGGLFDCILFRGSCFCGYCWVLVYCFVCLL